MKLSKVIRKSIEDYRRNFGKCLMIGLYSSFCMIIYKFILYFFFSLTGVFLPSFIEMLIDALTAIGVSYSCLIMARKEKKSLSKALFVGFKNPLRVLTISIKMMIALFLYGLFFILPGIMKFYSYSQVYFIYLDNPELSSNECFDQSLDLMKGKRMDLFGLVFLLDTIPCLLIIVTLYMVFKLEALGIYKIGNLLTITECFIILNIFSSPLCGLIYANFYSFLVDGDNEGGETKSTWNVVTVVFLIVITMLLFTLSLYGIIVYLVSYLV